MEKSDQGRKKFGSGTQVKHSGSETLVFSFRAGFMCWYDTGTCPVDIGGRRICLKYVNIETGVIGEKAKT
jgi:hypothetical protein